MQDIPTPSPKRKQSSVAMMTSALVIGAISLSCACCVLSMATLKAFRPSSPIPWRYNLIPWGFSGTLCAGLTSTPPVQAGMAWQSALMSSLPPLMLSPWAVCVNTPQVWPFTRPASLHWELLLP